MSNLVSLLKHPLTILFGSLMLFSIAVGFYVAIQKNAPEQKSLQPSSQTGELPRKNFTNSKDFLRKEVAPDNKIRYLYISPTENRPNEIITDEKNNIFFERMVLDQSSQTPTINQYKEALGNPDATMRGSGFYGEGPITYIYAQKGIAFIGGENGQILEVHRFQPTTTEKYIATYGGAISINHNH